MDFKFREYSLLHKNVGMGDGGRRSRIYKGTAQIDPRGMVEFGHVNLCFKICGADNSVPDLQPKDTEHIIYYSYI